MTLTDFLLARIAEDEAVAERLRKPNAGDPWGWQPRGLETCDKARVDYPPARVLADCEAKRRIVELHVPDRALENWYWSQRKCSECGGLWHVITPFAKPTDIGAEQGCRTVRALAAPHADHPDYREEWKP